MFIYEIPIFYVLHESKCMIFYIIIVALKYILIWGKSPPPRPGVLNLWVAKGRLVGREAAIRA